MPLAVALDTNVWSFIAEKDESDAFVALEQTTEFRTVLQPIALLEALHTSDEERRRRIVHALTASRAHRQRLVPEAASEAAEFVGEVRRLRPEWVRAYPRTDVVASLTAFWTKRLWRTAQRDFESLPDPNLGLPTHNRDEILRVQRVNQAAFRKNDFVLDPVDAVYLLDHAAPPALHPGWRRGDAIDSWRVDLMTVYWRELVVVPAETRRSPEHVDTTMADWIGAFVRLERLRRDEAGFDRLCLYEVDAERMPRSWIRGAVQNAQLALRLTSGNPSDTAHASYLMDCDLFITADRRFFLAIDAVRARAPIALTPVEFIDRNAPSAVAQIERAIRAHL